MLSASACAIETSTTRPSVVVVRPLAAVSEKVLTTDVGVHVRLVAVSAGAAVEVALSQASFAVREAATVFVKQKPFSRMKLGEQIVHTVALVQLSQPCEQAKHWSFSDEKKVPFGHVSMQ
jgi:hypothetical protein